MEPVIMAATSSQDMRKAMARASVLTSRLLAYHLTDRDFLVQPETP
jgi:hypothetical protein